MGATGLRGIAPIPPLSILPSAPLLNSGKAIWTDVEGLLASVSSDEAKLFCHDNEGFCENMSLMFRRRSNSGMSLPDMGKRFFVDQSTLRFPSTNIPGGLTMSLMYVTLSPRLTCSFRTAKTGQ